MILETSWGTATGWIIVRDALLVGPWRHETELSHTHRRTPTDYDAEHILLRTIRCVSGEVQTITECEPVYDYGRQTAKWSYTEHVYHQGVSEWAGLEHQADPDHGHAAWLRRRTGGNPHLAEGRRRPLRRLVVGGQRASAGL